MTAIEALLAARQHGVSVAVSDGLLRIKASGPVPMDVVDGLRAHKDALVQMMTLQPPAAGSDEDRRLIEQFAQLEPPEQPFDLRPGERVIDPTQWYAVLRGELLSAPSRPRLDDARRYLDLVSEQAA